LTLASYAAGLALSAVMDLPSSPVIVWAMAVIGTAVHLFARQDAPAGATGHAEREKRVRA
jgi:ABC-type Mn2+/Zn2+ transport system permease subunit